MPLISSIVTDDASINTEEKWSLGTFKKDKKSLSILLLKVYAVHRSALA